MTGVLNAMVGSGREVRIVTVGTSGTDAGFDGSMGSISSAVVRTGTVTTFRSGSSYDLWLDLDSPSFALTQASLVQLRIQDGSGAFRSLAGPAAASFIQVPATTTYRWIWGTGSNRVWATTDSGETKLAEFYF